MLEITSIIGSALKITYPVKQSLEFTSLGDLATFIFYTLTLLTIFLSSLIKMFMFDLNNYNNYQNGLIEKNEVIFKLTSLIFYDLVLSGFLIFYINWIMVDDLNNLIPVILLIVTIGIGLAIIYYQFIAKLYKENKNKTVFYELLLIKLVQSSFTYVLASIIKKLTDYNKAFPTNRFLYLFLFLIFFLIIYTMIKTLKILFRDNKIIKIILIFVIYSEKKIIYEAKNIIFNNDMAIIELYNKGDCETKKLAINKSNIYKIEYLFNE